MVAIRLGGRRRRLVECLGVEEPNRSQHSSCARPAALDVNIPTPTPTLMALVRAAALMNSMARTNITV